MGQSLPTAASPQAHRAAAAGREFRFGPAAMVRSLATGPAPDRPGARSAGTARRQRGRTLVNDEIGGMSTTTVVPPYGDGRSMTLIRCAGPAGRPTNRPSCSVLAGLRSGGWQPLVQLGEPLRGHPQARSSISIANPWADDLAAART